MTKAYDTELAPAGILLSQFAMLGYLYESGPQTVGAIGAHLGLDQTSATRTIRTLVDARWLSASRSATDKRQRIVGVTTKGTQKLREAYPLWQRAQKRLVQSAGNDAALQFLTNVRHFGVLLGKRD